MSLTPLKINAMGSLLQNQGLYINPDAVTYMGSSTSASTYTYGSIISDTCLYQLTRAITLAYPKINAGISATTYLNLISIGSTTIPALGNSKPTTYTTTYYDNSVSMTATGTESNSVIVNSTTGLLVNGTVVFDADIGTSILMSVVYYVSKVVDSTHFQISVTPNGTTRQLDDIVLVSSATAIQTPGAITRHGFLRQIPYQAYNEFYINNGSYSDFLTTFNACFSKKNQLNKVVTSLNNSITFLDGIYSNMNDLISADITGVNISTFYWGQDLIASGRAINLSSMDTFGSPVNLLRTLNTYRAITKAVSLLLLSAGFTSNDITSLVEGRKPTPEQEKTLYAVYTLIVDVDLQDVCTVLNCQTPNLTSLADLLDPKKLFPLSYKSLTYPIYNSVTLPTNSKTYYLLYTGENVNILSNNNIGGRLTGVLPSDLAYSADAFSIAMMQIKNIKGMSIEKFSQVVMNLENVSDLGVNNTNVPTNTALASAAISAIANGSGTNGLYTMGDYFGSMTSIHYDWSLLKSQILGIQSNTLANIYNSIYSLLAGGGPYSGLQALINSANAEITSIKNANLAKATLLNTTYSNFGTYLQKEKTARSLALNDTTNLTTTNNDILGFVNNIDEFASDTQLEGASLVLENIIDRTLIGGQNLIAAMREARNAKRLGYTGGVLDNDPDSVSPIVLPRKTGTTVTDMSLPGYDSSPGNNDITQIPIVTGAAIVPGSLGGSSETTLIPTNLSILVQPSNDSILVPNDAIQEVTTCNCDCWDMIQ